MAPKVRATFLSVVASVFFFASFYLRFFPNSIRIPPSPTLYSANFLIHENLTDPLLIPPHLTTSLPPPSTTAILLPDWELLVIASPDEQISLPQNQERYSCLFDTGELSPANFSGVLPFPDRATYTCVLPIKARQRLPFRQPVLTKSPPSRESQLAAAHSPPVLRWSFLVYDSLTTDNDVVLFAKGLNVRQGINFKPCEFRCVFGDSEIDAVKTTITTSMQEVFRCKRPELTAAVRESGRSVKVTLEIVAENRVVPSVAYYTPPRTLMSGRGKSLLCASTMVYDVAKFLREWVLYHSRIGVEKFLLYDNGSDDELEESVSQLVEEGFDITTYLWRWPKTQEAGFSHSAIYSRDACSWMMYLDVDEFIYSPNWHNISEPSKSLLHSFISSSPINSSQLGQISIGCHEFGPSDQEVHPIMGVTQGYNCRRMYENRHKSIVLLSGVDESLLNVIHHFELREGYKSRKVGVEEMVVNHYKYQAWPEFKAKFRRRVSAYVLDWTQKLNMNSNDRTPGLGYAPVEPQGWRYKFCEVRDDNLKDLVRRWFCVGSGKMAWQR